MSLVIFVFGYGMGRLRCKYKKGLPATVTANWDSVPSTKGTLAPWSKVGTAGSTSDIVSLVLRPATRYHRDTSLQALHKKPLTPC